MGNFEQKVNKFIEIFLEEGGYVKVAEGLQNTLLIAVAGLLIGIVIGTVIATVRVLPKYKVLPRVLNGICSFYVAMFRGTPIVVQLLVFYYVLLPLIGWKITGVQVAILVFGLNSGAYISEIMRSGIQSVDPGQMEAGRSLGLSYGSAMALIVIPQAVRTMIPSIINQFIITLKDTSILSVIAFPELTNVGKTIMGNTFKNLETWAIIGVMYMVVIITLSKISKRIERRVNRGR